MKKTGCGLKIKYGRLLVFPDNLIEGEEGGKEGLVVVAVEVAHELGEQLLEPLWVISNGDLAKSSEELGAGVLGGMDDALHNVGPDDSLVSVQEGESLLPSGNLLLLLLAILILIIS